MKTTKCKRCDAENVFWMQNANGKWQLCEERTGTPHYCDDGKLKAVKCKYCPANDLHWAEEIDPITKHKKMVLTESFGLPHACDERIAFIAKEKKDKKDKYEAEKKRINEHPEGKCPTCKGTGNNTTSQISVSWHCANCYGWGSFSPNTKKSIIAASRDKIWPNMPLFKRKY